MKVDGDWGCGDGSSCGVGNTQKWGPNSIYNLKCENCGTVVEFFKDEKKRTCSGCGQKVHNKTVGQDCC